MRKTLVLLLTSIAFCPQYANAQAPPAEDSSEPWHRSVSIGLRAGFRFLDPLGGLEAAVHDSAADPPQTTEIFSTSATKRFPVGPTVHFQLTDRWAVTADALFSRAGYDASSNTETQPEGEEDPDFISALYERTRANFWDFQFLGRYYYTGFEEDPARLYLTGGVAVRTVSGIRTFSELVLDDDLSDTSTVPSEAANKMAPGAVVGAGFRLQDEVGLKIDVGVHYTRWMARVFDSSVARSSPNEGTVFISFSF